MKKNDIPKFGERPNLVELTEAMIKDITMDELKEVFSSIDETTAKIMVVAIREGRYDKVAHCIEFTTYQVMQSKAIEAEK